MAIDWSGLIGSASPVSSAGLDPQELLASDDPHGRLAAAQAGVPYQVKPGQKATTLAGGTPSAVASPPQRTGVSNPPDGGAVRSIAPPTSPQPANNAPNPPSETPSGPQAVPASVQPSGGSQSKFPDVTRQMLGMKQQALKQAQAVPNAPDVGQIEQQETAARAAAPNPSDPNFKPSLKSRFLRGLEGVGLGLAEGGLRGAIAGGIAPQTTGLAGYRDPNSAFSRAKAANDQTVGSLDQQLKAAQDQQKIANEQITAQTGIANSAGTGAEQATQAGNAEKPPGKAQIITAGDGSLFSVDPNDPTHPTPVTGPDGKPIMGKNDGKYVQLEIGGQPHTVEVDDKGNTIKDLGATGEKPTNIHVGEGGTWSLQEQTDAQGKTKTVLMNSKTGDIKDAPAGLQKIGTDAKNQAAQEKVNEKYENVISSGAMAHQLQREAEKGNAEADPALALLYFKAIKGADGTGIRFTQTENSLIQHARNYAGDLEAIGQKVAGGGQNFTKDQRKNVVKIVDLYVQAAQRARAAKSAPNDAAPASSPAAAKGGFNWDEHPKVNP